MISRKPLSKKELVVKDLIDSGFDFPESDKEHRKQILLLLLDDNDLVDKYKTMSLKEMFDLHLPISYKLIAVGAKLSKKELT